MKSALQIALLSIGIGVALFPAPVLADHDGDNCSGSAGDAAIAACTRAIGSGRYHGRGLEALYYNRGNAYQNRGDLDRALADYGKAIDLDRNDADAYLNRGIAFLSKSDVDRAVADFSKAIELKPKYAAAYFNRGNAYMAKSDVDRALADYGKAIALDPTYAVFFNNRGLAYVAKGDLNRALADFTRAIGLDPRHVSAYTARGLAYEVKGDFERALADFGKAIDLDPRNAVAYNSRCWLRATAGRDLDRALSDCDAAVRLAPDDADAINSRGFVYLRLDRLDEAVRDYDAALKIDAASADALYGRGIARLKQGVTAGGQADIAAAKERQTDIADVYAGYGIITPPSVGRGPAAAPAQSPAVAALPETPKPGAFCPDSTAARSGFVLVEPDGARERIEPSTDDVVTSSHTMPDGSRAVTPKAYKGFFVLGAKYDFDYKDVPLFVVGYHKVFHEAHDWGNVEVELRVEGAEPLRIGDCTYDTFVVKEDTRKADGTKYILATKYYSPALRQVVKTEGAVLVSGNTWVPLTISYVKLEPLN